MSREWSLFSTSQRRSSPGVHRRFPLSKAGLLEWQFIALQIPLPIEALFHSEIDINPPFDRSPKGEGRVHPVSDRGGLSIPYLSELCRPSRTALIIYDMQVGMVSQIDEGKRLLGKNGMDLLQTARQAGYPVYYTRHRWLPNRLAGVGQLRRAMICTTLTAQ